MPTTDWDIDLPWLIVRDGNGIFWRWHMGLSTEWERMPFPFANPESTK